MRAVTTRSWLGNYMHVLPAETPSGHVSSETCIFSESISQRLPAGATFPTTPIGWLRTCLYTHPVESPAGPANSRAAGGLEMLFKFTVLLFLVCGIGPYFDGNASALINNFAFSDKPPAGSANSCAAGGFMYPDGLVWTWCTCCPDEPPACSLCARQAVRLTVSCPAHLKF